VAAILFACAAAGCGKKGPPLAPLHLVPDRPPTLKARVIGDTVYLDTVVPTKNANGPGALTIDRLEVYAATRAAGEPAPPNRDLLNDKHAVGRIPVKPPVDPDAPVDEDAEKDPRPGPGDPVHFVQTLGPAERQPEIVPPPKPAKRAAPAAAAAPDALMVPTRFYVVRGVTKGGRPGAPSPRVAVPLVSAPPAPRAIAASFTQDAVALSWTPPADAVTRIDLTVRRGVPVAPGTPPDPATGLPPTPPAPSWTPVTPTLAVPPLRYNVYAASTPATGGATEPAPLNEQPLESGTFEHAGAEPGKEQCFVVRSVQLGGDVSIESPAAGPACVTPADVFPPAAPKALASVAGAGGINLIWDANTEADLAGYLVLRAEPPGDTLQPLTAQPIRDTRYIDATARPGVLYVYVVVAVDQAGNRSANSNKVTETGR
jgi:hypothetical protein